MTLTRLLTLACLLLLPTQGWGAIALETSAQSTAQVGTAITVSFTAPAGSVITVSTIGANRDVTSVDYNGGTFEELYDQTGDGAGDITRTSCHLSVTGADGASHTLTVNYATSTNPGHIIVASWSGVNTSSNAAAHRTVYSDKTSVGDQDVTVVDSQSGDVVVQSVGNWGTNLTAEQTNIITANALGAGAYDHLMQYANASGGNTAMTVAGGQYGQTCAYALIPAAASAARSRMLLGVGQ